ncbi:hypothetical protein LINPERHAP1_LOCUS7407 [Linum perenne]
MTLSSLVLQPLLKLRTLIWFLVDTIKSLDRLLMFLNHPFSSHQIHQLLLRLVLLLNLVLMLQFLLAHT